MSGEVDAPVLGEAVLELGASQLEPREGRQDLGDARPDGCRNGWEP